MNRLIVFIFILNLFAPRITQALPGEMHARDMVSIFDSTTAPQLKMLALEISKTIDNQKALPGISKGMHRLYGHWGFTAAIPFNSDGFKAYLEKFPAEERAREIERIRQMWKSDVQYIIDMVHLYTDLPPRQAQALAAVFYDMHMIGDWTTAETSALKELQWYKNDLVKNIAKFDKNVALEMEESLNRAEAECAGDSRKLADRYREILKKSQILKHALLKRMPKDITKPAVLALVYTKIMHRYSGLPERQRKLLSQSSVIALVSMMSGAYEYFSGDNAFLDVLKSEAGNFGTGIMSTIVSDALVQQVNGKLIMRLPITKATARCLGATANAGMISFIFDAGHASWNYVQGDIDGNELQAELGRASIRAAGASAATYAAVAVGFSPAGPIVMVVGIGGYIIANKAIDAYQHYQSLQYVSIRDVPGILPSYIRNLADCPVVGHIPATLFQNQYAPGLLPSQVVPGYAPGRLPSQATPGYAPGRLPPQVTPGYAPGHLPSY